MSRQIKFRGISQGKWVYGYLMNMHNDDRLFIGVWKNIGGEATIKDELFMSYSEVINESTGQFTGLKDKNGKEIYEGDIVKVNSVIVNGFENESYGSETEFTIFCEVTWCKEIGGFDLKKIDGDKEPTAWSFYNENINPFEVIDNIYENKELLEVENEN